MTFCSFFREENEFKKVSNKVYMKIQICKNSIDLEDMFLYLPTFCIIEDPLHELLELKMMFSLKIEIILILHELLEIL